MLLALPESARNEQVNEGPQHAEHPSLVLVGVGLRLAFRGCRHRVLLSHRLEGPSSCPHRRRPLRNRRSPRYVRALARVVAVTRDSPSQRGCGMPSGVERDMLHARPTGHT